mgnify:CR=1 FL=1
MGFEDLIALLVRRWKLILACFSLCLLSLNQSIEVKRNLRWRRRLTRRYLDYLDNLVDLHHLLGSKLPARANAMR